MDNLFLHYSKLALRRVKYCCTIQFTLEWRCDANVAPYTDRNPGVMHHFTTLNPKNTGTHSHEKHVQHQQSYQVCLSSYINLLFWSVCFIKLFTLQLVCEIITMILSSKSRLCSLLFNTVVFQISICSTLLRCPCPNLFWRDSQYVKKHRQIKLLYYFLRPFNLNKIHLIF